MARSPSYLRRAPSESASAGHPVHAGAQDGPWATLRTPILWPLSTKLWTFAFGWLLQTTVDLLTFNWDLHIMPRAHRCKLWIDTGETGRCRLVLHYPRNPASTPPARAPGVVVHMHGGGWTICRPEIEYRIAQHMADELGTVVVSPAYRKAPWYPYPHALLQLHAVLNWIASGGLNVHPQTPDLAVDPSRIALSGGSAGANLAASLALLCTHRPLGHDARIVALGLLYPSLDASTPYTSKVSGHDDAKVVRPPWFNRFILHAYLPPPRDVRDPYVSPFVAPEEDLRRFPPTAVVTASEDYLCAEGDAFARKLEELGVRVAHRRFENVEHAFDLVPAVGAAKQRINASSTKDAHGMLVDVFRKAFD